jgi:GNAT superfamily N-acetyltransferase
MHDTDTRNPTLPPLPAFIRRATAADIDALAHHRVSMFRDMGVLDEADADSLRRVSIEYFRRAMAAGRYLAWVAVAEHDALHILAGAGLSVEEILPRPGQQGLNLGPDGVVLNVYTEPAWRGRGLASRLVREILEWARTRGIERVNLHASEDGRSVYERIGFIPTNEMRYTIPARPSTDNR